MHSPADTQPRSAPGLPAFATPAAAAAHYRKELGITGEPPAGAAWRLAEHLGAVLGTGPKGPRFRVIEDTGLALIFYFPDEAWICVPAPEREPDAAERERILLHEIGHLLLTWRCRAVVELCCIPREERGGEEYAYWQDVYRWSERQARGFVAAWLAG